MICAICCVSNDKLLRCARCKFVFYCSREHQKQDWKKHKAVCSQYQGDIEPAVGTSADKKPTGKNERQSNTVLWKSGKFTGEGSSENEILTARTEALKSNYQLGGYSEINLDASKSLLALDKEGILERVSVAVVRDMDAYGVCVVDDFLGPELGKSVRDEVVGMYNQGLFKDGQTVNSTGDVRSIRRDKITWLDGSESQCRYIGALIARVDTVIQQANKMLNNGKMGMYKINGRTKAMCACYPAQGSHYVKHVDNPNHDGRIITAIYYLNTDWDVQRDGGLLRIFPQEWQDRVADIVPQFDRLLFFWSDRRNPHEVQPAFRTRYAITLWYFDANERAEATKRYQVHKPLTSS